ncbi:MAG: hypothetical protein ACRD8O_00455 [Bryobacteraceae bacterium]
MSAQAGVYNFDGRPVDPDLLARLALRLELRGPDGCVEYRGGPLGMVYRAFHTTKESRQETQPLVSRYGHALTWDGRLDNRRDLIAQLGASAAGATTDAGLVMAAYLRWGRACFEKLIGDFASSRSAGEFRARARRSGNAAERECAPVQREGETAPPAAESAFKCVSNQPISLCK